MASPAGGKRSEASSNAARSRYTESATTDDTLVEANADVEDSKAPRRINVAVTPEAIRGIEQVIANEGVTLTEAVRRLLNYGHFVYEQVKERGGELELTTADGKKKDVVFI